MGVEAELKHKLLKLLKEDEEFRYAVAGLIGLGGGPQEAGGARQEVQRDTREAGQA